MFVGMRLPLLVHEELSTASHSQPLPAAASCHPTNQMARQRNGLALPKLTEPLKMGVRCTPSTWFLDEFLAELGKTPGFTRRKSATATDSHSLGNC